MNNAELQHYGVVGMKWGIRKDAARADKKWAKSLSKSGARPVVDAYNAAADAINNGGAERFNAQPRWQGVNMLEEGPKQKAYYDEYSEMFTKELNKSLVNNGLSPTGAYRVELEWHALQDALPRWSIVETTARHSALTDVEVIATYDARGFVTTMRFKPAAVQHSEDVPLADDSIGNLPLAVLHLDPDAFDSMAYGAEILDGFFYED